LRDWQGVLRPKSYHFNKILCFLRYTVMVPEGNTGSAILYIQICIIPLSLLFFVGSKKWGIGDFYTHMIGSLSLSQVCMPTIREICVSVLEIQPKFPIRPVRSLVCISLYRLTYPCSFCEYSMKY